MGRIFMSMSYKYSPFNETKTDVDVRLCDWPQCQQQALHRAPRPRYEINSYKWFCLGHIRLYNKSWNYYAGMSEEEVENDIRDDTVWGRPSWPLGAAKRAAAGHFDDDFGIFDEQPSGKKRSPPHQGQQSAPEITALNILDLKPPVSIKSLKVRYKELVKRYHPDVTGGDKASEEKFKQISQAYHTIINSLAS